MEEGTDNEVSEPNGDKRLSQLLVLFSDLSASREFFIVVFELLKEAVEVVDEEDVHQTERNVNQYQSQFDPVLLS